MPAVEYLPLRIPTSIDADDAEDFRTMTVVRNAIYREISGHDDDHFEPVELLPAYQPDEYEKRMLWTVRVDGEMVGRVGLDLPTEDGSRVSYGLIELLRRWWGQGIGAGAHELLERTARDNGRTLIESWAEHPDAPGERIAPPTGFGSIPRDHAARFYLAHGYTLEQVERHSILDLNGPLTEIERLLGEAEDASPDYRIVQWMVPTPPEFAAGYAWMKSRMSTDAPAAALEFDEESWDAARVAVHDAQYTDGGRMLQVTAAQHIETGELCAFNELSIGADRTRATQQDDTLVLKDHRGHRLGMRVKCAGLLSWHERVPESPRVITYNAEENRPMLDVNEAIGFVPISYGGAWKKILA